MILEELSAIYNFVPALPEVERFIEQNHYQVSEGSYY